MGWLLRLFWVLLALVAFFLAALAVNQQEVALVFLRWQSPQLSVFWWLLGAFGGGLLLGLIGILMVGARARLRQRGLAKRVAELESERHPAPLPE